MNPRIAVLLPRDWEAPGKAEKYLRYLNWLSQAGAEAVPVTSLSAFNPKAFAGALFTGGEDVDPRLYGETPQKNLRHPLHVSRDRDEFELGVLQRVLPKGIPVLGICRGLQLLNIALGGSLYQDLETALDTPVRHRKYPNQDAEHVVFLEWGTRLFALLGRRSIRVNSAHHQGIKKLGKGLRVAARSEDRVIEGIELPDHPFFIGVQWHPERYPSPASRKLVEAFVQATRAIRL